eukprot:7132616-Pyramimonas_sp.AAC.1
MEKAGALVKADEITMIIPYPARLSLRTGPSDPGGPSGPQRRGPSADKDRRWLRAAILVTSMRCPLS